MDDYRMVLGMEFLDKIQPLSLEKGHIMCITDGTSSHKVPLGRSKTKSRILSAIQLSKGLKKGEPTFLATLQDEQLPGKLDVPKEVQCVLETFSDVMLQKLPPRREVDHEIEHEPGTKPPAMSSYRMAPPKLEELRRQLKELLDVGFIRPFKAPFGAPVLFQKKHDGSLRMCIDYRGLNKVTVKNKYPIPLVADLFDRILKARWFTKLDLRSWYWQARIAEGDEPKTTCVMRYGSFEFLVMLFGLTNAPATFYTLMNKIFHPFLDEFVVVYLDDIVVYSKTLEEDVEYLQQVFQVLRENELYVKIEKCLFAQLDVMFLGHKVAKGKIHMDESKIHAIAEWKEPKKVSELRSFLGLVNYYRRFILGYLARATPLTELLKKKGVWEWSEKCQAAFDDLK
ncbi:hypothetical protein LIER_07137 [Lithospermum erythrorhizon]|uniref:Reverse transcriptase domain-containing protein n=1 Tax=Lithospermum erythrorhizon TaxID=34254 RepID=A0AAV3PBE8_LITER